MGRQDASVRLFPWETQDKNKEKHLVLLAAYD